MMQVMSIMVRSMVGDGKGKVMENISIRELGITKILLQLCNIIGHDCTTYKESHFRQRIEWHILQHGIEDTGVYATYIQNHPEEASILFKELLINFTFFFRDKEAFELLKNEILPQLRRGKTDNDMFHAWVAGSASGEEAYSMAILLSEYMTETRQSFQVLIYGTDVDDEAVAIARKGFYPLNIAQNVTEERLNRFFAKEETGYRISEAIHKMVVFSVQNVIEGLPFTQLDLLSCRNLMIYLTPELQNRLFSTFYSALKPNGVLSLSAWDGVGIPTDKFTASSDKWGFYRALGST
jgi:two-component system CheB/CheR fusion protein